MKKVLITGVAGFVGSNLADRLVTDGGYYVVGIDNLSWGVRTQVPSAVEFHECDIREEGLGHYFEGVDYVFHLAAKNSIIDCQNDPVETADINVRGTANVFEACARAGVKKVVYAESSAVYEGSATLPTREDDLAPESFYAVSKVAGKYFADAYARYRGLAFTALRYFCVYGPRQDYRRTIPPVFSAFIIRLMKNERPVIYGTGEKRRDFVHVDDVNDFHIQCIQDPRTDGGTFNLGSGKNYSINEIYTVISEMLDRPIPPEYRNDQPGEAFATLADISEAKRLGWEPKTSLKDGLKSAVEFIASEKAAGRI